jgi:hypothetical protein
LRSMEETITCRLLSVNNRLGTYQTVTPVISSFFMDVYEIRRLRLRELIDTRFRGVVKRCAEHMEMKPPQLHRWLSTKSKDSRRIEYDSARTIEEKNGLPAGWLDVDHGGAEQVGQEPLRIEQPAATYGPPVTDEEADLLSDLRELLPDKRETFARDIRAMAVEARAYKVMGMRNTTPVGDADVAKHLPPAPTEQPPERRQDGPGRRTSDEPPQAKRRSAPLHPGGGRVHGDRTPTRREREDEADSSDKKGNDHGA